MARDVTFLCFVGPAELSSRVWGEEEVEQAFDRWPGLHHMKFCSLWLLGETGRGYHRGREMSRKSRWL